MSWEKEIIELRLRKLKAEELGGESKINRQHDAGRYTVLERINLLVDKGSFKSIGSLAGKYITKENLKNFIPANSIIGHALINDFPVIIYGDDFTIRGGASDAAIHEKMNYAECFANEYELPIIRLIEGTGGGGSIKSLEMNQFSYIPFNPGWEWVVSNLSKIPVVSLALGPVAGLGAARLVSSHYSIMIKNLSQIFVAGPALVEKTGEKVTKEELGGSLIHGKNGVVDAIAENEKHAFELTKKFLSFMPSSTSHLPKRLNCNDPSNRADEWLINAVPRSKRTSYEMYPIIKSIVDKLSFFEIGNNYGKSAITGFARLNGYPIVLIANNPQIYGGGWTSIACQKITKILDIAQLFHFPILHLVDNPGFVIGTHAEKEGTIKYGAKTLAAIYQLKVPICSVIIRKAFGVAGAGHMNHTRHRHRFAWPSGYWGSLPPEGGIETAYKSELAKSKNPALLIAEIKDRLDKFESPFKSAEKFLIEDIIDPRETRTKVCEWIKLAFHVIKKNNNNFYYRP